MLRYINYAYLMFSLWPMRFFSELGISPHQPSLQYYIFILKLSILILNKDLFKNINMIFNSLKEILWKTLFWKEYILDTFISYSCVSVISL